MALVSVIIPTYNCAHFLSAAIESVLAQTYRDFEILVIDDGSTDDTEAVVRRYGAAVRYLRQANGGVSSARNRGLAEATGRFVGFLDADDTWLPGKLATQIAVLREGQDRSACYSSFFVTDSTLKPLGVRCSSRKGSALEDLLLRGNVIGSICTVLCKRSLFDDVGGFDLSLSQCADWDMWVRLAALTDFLYIDEPLVTYRQHGTSMSRSAPLLERDSVRVLEKGFAMPCLPAHVTASQTKARARNYMVLAGTYYHARLYRDFLRCAAHSLALNPRQFGYLLAFPVRAASRVLSRRSTAAGR